jgi:hypothetical protein
LEGASAGAGFSTIETMRARPSSTNSGWIEPYSEISSRGTSCTAMTLRP